MAVLIEVPTLAAFAACCVMLALAYAYKSTLGALIQHLAELLAGPSVPVPFSHPVHPFAFAADALRQLDNAILAALGAGIKGTEWAFHKLVSFQGYALQEIGHAMHDLAQATWRRFDSALTADVPRLIHDAIALAAGDTTATLARLRRDVRAAEATITADVAALGRDARAAEHATATRISRVERAGQAAVAAAVAETLPRIRAAEHDLSGLRDRLRGIGRTLTPAGIVGLVLAAVGALGLGWTRCANVRDVGNAACRMDRGLLDALLADTALILGTVSLVEFAQGMQGIVSTVESDVRRFWRVG